MISLKLWGVVALGVTLAITAAYWVGKREGATQAETATLQNSIDTLRERKLTDEQIQGMSDAGLCDALGGVMLPDGTCQ